MTASPCPTEPDLASRPFERVLLIKPSSLGDIVHALPVLHGLRTRFTDARIDWLIGTPHAALLEGNGELDEAVLFDRRRFGKLGRSWRVTKDFVAFVRRLRAKRYDLVIDLQGLFRTGFLSRATGAPVRIGFGQAREAAWMFYTHRIHVDDRDMHAVDRYYLVGTLLGFSDVPIEFNLAPADSVREDARNLLRTSGVGPHERIVAVVPGARWETKRWASDRFAATLDQLHRVPDVRCVLIGGPGETDSCALIANACRSSPVNLAGRTSIRQMAAVLALADTVLCHDSAAAHLAAALGRALVCLTGPTNPRRTGPYRRPDSVVRLDLDCSPCYIRRLARCRFGHQCMRDLDTATVVAAVRHSLDSADIRSV